MEINNTQDIIDSRDVIERIDELTEDREAYNEEHGQQPKDSTVWESRHPDEADELATLLALQNQAEGYAADWRYGETLIRDSYFEDYARQLAEDCGMIDRADTWPGCFIDWKQAAEELQHDYTCVDFDGVDYWIR